MTLTRNQWLIAVAASLASIKFLLMPWIEQQATAIEELTVLTQRLDRSAGVIQNREAIRKAVADIEAKTNLVRGRFPGAADAQGYRIDVQERVSAEAAQAGLNLRSFEWVVDGQAPEARLAYSRARIQLEGGFRTLVTWQANLEGRFPNMSVRELNLVSTAMLSGPDDSGVSLTLVVDFYFRPVAGAGIP